MWGKCMKKKTPAANLLRQAIQFIGISGIGWLMDFTIFSLLGLCSANLTINNIISSSVAVSFVFVVSTCKTFVQKNGGMNLKIKFAIYSYLSNCFDICYIALAGIACCIN